MRHRSFNNTIKSLLKELRMKIKEPDFRVLIRSLRPKRTDKNLIRLGGDSDGGYLLPNDLENIAACFSAGVGEVSSFEFDCAEMGMNIFMADASVDAPVINDPRFTFRKKFIGGENKGDYITLEKWIKESEIEPSGDLLLQMDIEGAEYEVLNSLSNDTLKKLRIIIVEFHDLHLLYDKEFYRKARSAFGKILQNHVCVHIHPNNSCNSRLIKGIEIPEAAEFTFIRKDRVKILGDAKEFPHPFDRDNIELSTIVLPPFWFGE